MKKKRTTPFNPENLQLSEDLLDFTSRFFGNELDLFRNGLSNRIRSKIRISPFKQDPEIVKKGLEGAGISLAPQKWYTNAYNYSPAEAFPGQTLEHHLGYFYLQDFSSMLPVLILDPQPGETVLDMAAAPGSKATQLATHMNNSGTLVVNDVDTARLSNLAFNLDRMGIYNTQIVRHPGEQLGSLLPDTFDRVLLDAPCSALGVLNSKQEVAGWWSYQRMHQYAGIQEKLLISALKACKPGGRILYSTCTLTPEENELIIQKVLSKYGGELLPVQIPEPFVTRDGLITWNGDSLSLPLNLTKRIYPMDNQWDCQGFFLALIQKNESPGKIITRRHQNEDRTGEIFYKKQLETWFGIEKEVTDPLKFISGSDIWLQAGDFEPFPTLNTQRSGMRMGRRMGEKLKMTTDFLQLFGRFISNHRFDIQTEAEFRLFMNGNSIPGPDGNYGQLAVFYKNYCLGSGLLQNRMIKSQIPTSRRFDGKTQRSVEEV